MKEENLVGFTSDQDREACKENGKKGGKASGKSRRRKADLRKMAQAILTGTYKDSDGAEMTGEEILLHSILKNVASPRSKNWGKAVDTLIDLTGARITPEQKKKLKAETELLRAKAAVLRGEHKGEREDDGFLESLAGTAAEDWADEDEHL